MGITNRVQLGCCMRNLFRAALIAGTVLTSLVPATAGAQSGLDGRVDKLEREMRAVQRSVCPGGAGKTLQPEITAPTVTAPTPGIPATSALADLETRIAAIEGQQTTLTRQIEESQHRIRLLEDAFAAYKAANEAKVAAGGPAIAAEPVDTATSVPTPAATSRPTAGAKPTPAKPEPVQTEVVAAGRIERPSSGDAGEDSYIYGYRLWEAKRYTEAQTALKDTVAKFPKHRRASYAQNLLGRSYLDEGRPSLASMAFYDSFKKWPDGERAPDSLYFLGQSLVKLGKPADACTVYGELTTTYGAKIGPDLKAKVDKGRADAKCK